MSLKRATKNSSPVIVSTPHLPNATTSKNFSDGEVIGPISIPTTKEEADKALKDENEWLQQKIHELQRENERNSEPGTKASTPNNASLADQKKAQKGDITLLQNSAGELKSAVALKTAESYLGISSRQRQYLIKRGALFVIGGGLNRKIRVESLLNYLSPEKTK